MKNLLSSQYPLAVSVIDQGGINLFNIPIGSLAHAG
jgi:hypothetical protein